MARSRPLPPLLTIKYLPPQAPGLGPNQPGRLGIKWSSSKCGVLEEEAGAWVPAVGVPMHLVDFALPCCLPRKPSRLVPVAMVVQPERSVATQPFTASPPTVAVEARVIQQLAAAGAPLAQVELLLAEGQEVAAIVITLMVAAGVE